MGKNEQTYSTYMNISAHKALKRVVYNPWKEQKDMIKLGIKYISVTKL